MNLFLSTANIIDTSYLSLRSLKNYLCQSAVDLINIKSILDSIVLKFRSKNLNFRDWYKSFDLIYVHVLLGFFLAFNQLIVNNNYKLSSISQFKFDQYNIMGR